MSNFITTAFVNEFRDNVMHLSQQSISRLRGAVRVEQFTGEKAFFEQLGPVTMQKKTARHADTPLIETPHARRMVLAEEYEWAELIGRGDRARTLVEFTNPYLQGAAKAAGRTMDQIIIDAATSVAKTGQNGTTNTSFDNNMDVATTVGPNSGLNVEKLQRAKRNLDQREVDPSIPRYICANARQMDNLLNDEEVRSFDYNTVKALVNGEIDTFMGFTFIQSELINAVSSDDKVLYWAQDGLLLGINYDVVASVDVRPDKSYDTQAYLAFMAGATRMEEAKVGTLTCAQTPTDNT